MKGILGTIIVGALTYFGMVALFATQIPTDFAAAFLGRVMVFEPVAFVVAVFAAFVYCFVVRL